MKIELSHAPHRVDDLLRFLRQMGYAADEASYGVIEISGEPQRKDALGVAAVTLALRLRVWNAVNGSDARIVQEAEQERFRLRQDVSKLTHRHAEVTARLRHFLMSELEVLAQHEEERPVGFMKLIPSREAEALPPVEPEEVVSEAEEQEQQPLHAAHAPADEAEPATEPAPTTYADLYARAARRGEAEGPEEAPRPVDYEAEDDEEPAWTLRSLVSDEEFVEGAGSGEPRTFERDQLRRIIDDLD
jgi:hypothetical protein